MENQKEYCENLLEKYRDLEQKTALKLFGYKRGEKMKPQHIPMEYFEEFGKIRKEIKGCFNYFSDDILGELFDDFDFRPEIGKILMERIKNKNRK